MPQSPWKDREVRAKFFDLAKELGELGAWVRLQYVYPYPHVDEVIGLMTQGKVLPYLDIPFQHASPEILKAMKRPAAQDKTLARIKKWREECPDLTLRSTFIVGFPGETDSDFAYLLDWLEEAEIDRVGCFKYEPVAGASSNAIGNPVPEEIKQERWNALDGAAAEPFRRAGSSARSARGSRSSSTRSGPPCRRAVPRPMRPRSTARSMSPAAVRCASVKSSPRKSNAPTNTICTAASRDFDSWEARHDRAA